MNKMILKIMMILGLIAPVWASAMQRVDSPGVAQRKLNLLLKDAREMSESDRKQALADLSPSLRENYEEAIENMATRKLENFDKVVAAISSGIEKGTLKDSNEISKVAKELATALGLDKDGKDRIDAVFSNDGKEKVGQEWEVISKENSSLKKLEGIDKEDDSHLKIDIKVTQFLADVNTFLEENLEYDKKNKYYKVKDDKGRQELSCDGFTTSPWKDLCKKVNSFCEKLETYQNQTGYDITSVQQGFLEDFFPLVNTLYNYKDQLNEAGIANFLKIIEKGIQVLEGTTWTRGFIRNKKDTFLSKHEESNKNDVGTSTVLVLHNDYIKFIEQYQEIKKLKV